MSYQTNRTQPRCALPSPPAVTEWSRLLLNYIRYSHPARYSAFSVGRKCVPGDLDLWPMTLTSKFVWARDQTHLPYEFGANLLSGSRDISYTKQRQKQNLTQFTACGNNEETEAVLHSMKARDTRKASHWKGTTLQQRFKVLTYLRKTVEK